MILIVYIVSLLLKTTVSVYLSISLSLTVSNCRKQLLVTVKDNNVCAGHTPSRQGDKQSDLTHASSQAYSDGSNSC